METTKFKSNIKCAACVAKVTSGLDQVVGAGNWEVDLKDPSRTLTVKGKIDKAQINQELQKVGYKVEAV